MGRCRASTCPASRPSRARSAATSSTRAVSDRSTTSAPSRASATAAFAGSSSVARSISGRSRCAMRSMPRGAPRPNSARLPAQRRAGIRDAPWSRVTFNPDARLDPSQVRDRRGVGGGVVIGGGAAIVILLAAMLLGVDPSAVFDAIDTTSTSTVQNGPSASECQTGADANRRDDCRIVGFVDSVQSYWGSTLGSKYVPAKTVLFSGATQSACGTATTAMGPFYCPEDEKVYLDVDFFAALRTQL